MTEMKKIFAITFLVCVLLQHTNAQDKNMISAQLSYNQIELGFEHKILNERLSAGLYAGIANQDINSNFNDFTSRLGIGYIVFSNPQNQVSIRAGVGFYFPNNNDYSITVPFAKAGLRYARLFGKTKSHELFINAGYQYGKKDYRQQYSSDIVNISTIGTFKLTPVYFSIGYGFKF